MPKPPKAHPGVLVRPTRLAITLLMVTLAFGCRSGSQGFGVQSRGRQDVLLEVDNNNFLEVVVYAVAGGSSVRLGEVSGKGSTELTVNLDRISIVSGIQFRLSPIGSNQVYLTNTVLPNPGTRVILTIASDLRFSHAVSR